MMMTMIGSCFQVQLCIMQVTRRISWICSSTPLMGVVTAEAEIVSYLAADAESETVQRGFCFTVMRMRWNSDANANIVSG
jgi:hypothetical protein